MFRKNRANKARLVLVLLLTGFDWGKIFKPITKLGNHNRVITFDGHFFTNSSCDTASAVGQLTKFMKKDGKDGFRGFHGFLYILLLLLLYYIYISFLFFFFKEKKKEIYIYIYIYIIIIIIIIIIYKEIREIREIRLFRLFSQTLLAAPQHWQYRKKSL